MDAHLPPSRLAEQLRLLIEVSKHFTSFLDIDELLEQVVSSIQKAFGYYHVGVGLVEGDEIVYRVGSGQLWNDPNFQFKPARLKIGKEGLTGWVAATAKPLNVPDVSRDSRYVWMQSSQTCSELTVPILVNGAVIGILDVQSDQLESFDLMDLELMQALANQIGVAIENARLFTAEQRRAEQFRVLTEVSRKIASILDINELLVEIAKLIQQAFGYYHVKIGLIEGDSVVYQMGAGAILNDPNYQGTSSQLKIGREGITGWVAVTGEPFVTPDVSKEPRYLRMQGSQAQSELTVPVVSKGKVIGVLDIESDHLNNFDDIDIELMMSLANQIGVAIENARLYENARQVAVVEERNRLARELHDSVTQSLYGITLYSQAAAMQLALGHLEQVDKNLGEIHQISKESLAEMRLLIFELRPLVLEKEGLVAALQARLSAVEGRAGLRTSFKSDLTDRLPLMVEEALYHIAHEALNNVLKHAHARRTAIYLSSAHQKVTLEIVDDGTGFDPLVKNGHSMGLLSMREHAAEINGQLTLTSKPGQGTQVWVEVPI